MEKDQLPIFAELTLADTEDSTVKILAKKFFGTENPRELRAIHALMTRSVTREQLDSVVGCSNGPDLIGRLRDKGLDIPCVKTPVLDRDGKKVYRGIFHLTEHTRRLIIKWQACEKVPT